jgi:large-conductance mechanosensitive channel
MSSKKIGDLIRMLFVEYHVFATAFAVVLAENFQNILVALVDNLIYPLIYRLTKWKPQDDMQTFVAYKPILSTLIRFGIVLLLVYIMYKYREKLVDSFIE